MQFCFGGGVEFQLNWKHGNNNDCELHFRNTRKFVSRANGALNYKSLLTDSLEINAPIHTIYPNHSISSPSDQ